jgi:two-component system, OmpR family, alkaline phosphatase synthesis response regulator PhoP
VTEAAAAARVLVVTHEEETRVLLRRTLRNAGYEVEEAADAAQAVDALLPDLAPLVLLDLGLPRREGWALLANLRALPDPPRVVVLVARADHRGFAQAIRGGASAYVFQPFVSYDVVALCQAVLARAVPPPTGDERRHPRRLVAAEVSVFAADGSTLGMADLVSLGAGGAQVRLPVRLDPSTRLRLTLPVPVGNALTLDAVVQWNGRAASGFAHGLQFVDVTLALRRQLGDLLEPTIS